MHDAQIRSAPIRDKLTIERKVKKTWTYHHWHGKPRCPLLPISWKCIVLLMLCTKLAPSLAGLAWYCHAAQWLT
eukprot:1505716-Amphidinium_carterae.1